MTEPTVAPGQEGGGEAVGRVIGDFDLGIRRQVGAQARPGLAVERGKRAHDHRGDRQFVFLQDHEADTAAGRRVDAVPAEERLHRRGVMRLVGAAKIVGQGAESARVPPTPAGDQRDAEQKADQRRGETTEPGMPEEELQHEGEGR